MRLRRLLGARVAGLAEGGERPAQLALGFGRALGGEQELAELQPVGREVGVAGRQTALVDRQRGA